ncbi:unnamed protein product [Orchesella dallaii]|uniref:Uncharacterized protein n=1 Tax=Orchesella dallaii TaxID=48710 RepID=A0ABP1S4V4_9HEXA
MFLLFLVKVEEFGGKWRVFGFYVMLGKEDLEEFWMRIKYQLFGNGPFFGLKLNGDVDDAFEVKMILLEIKIKDASA